MKAKWKKVGEHQDIRYEKWQGLAKVTINRPEVRNAFRPQTLFEMSAAFEDAREDQEVGVVILTGEGAFTDVAETSRSRGAASGRRRRGPPAPRRTCSRAASRFRPAPECQPARRAPR